MGRRRVSKTIAGMSPSEIEDEWHRQNNDGMGFNPEPEWDRWERLGSTGRGGDAMDVYRDTEGNIVAVADAHGPWAQIVKRAKESRCSKCGGRMERTSGSIASQGGLEEVLEETGWDYSTRGVNHLVLDDRKIVSALGDPIEVHRSGPQAWQMEWPDGYTVDVVTARDFRSELSSMQMEIMKSGRSRRADTHIENGTELVEAIFPDSVPGGPAKALLEHLADARGDLGDATDALFDEADRAGFDTSAVEWDDAGDALSNMIMDVRFMTYVGELPSDKIQDEYDGRIMPINGHYEYDPDEDMFIEAAGSILADDPVQWIASDDVGNELAAFNSKEMLRWLESAAVDIRW